MQFHNRTELDTDRLRDMCLSAVSGWRLRNLRVFVRYSRGADFSGTCYFRRATIYVNLGRHVQFPYQMGTLVARAVTSGNRWWRPRMTIDLADAYQLALFVFLHETYHWLIHVARRNRRQKEAMCDRFATRVLLDRYGTTLRDRYGRVVPRDAWDFQDLDGFVAAARSKRPVHSVLGVMPPPPPASVTVLRPPVSADGQLLLFPA